MSLNEFSIRYQQILQYRMDNKETDEIVGTCKKYGNEDPQLWVQALSYFSKLREADGSRKEIQQILKCSSSNFLCFSERTNIHFE